MGTLGTSWAVFTRTHIYLYRRICILYTYYRRKLMKANVEQFNIYFTNYDKNIFLILKY